MPLPNIFDANVSKQIIARIDSLSSNTQPLWGTMSVDQVLAHCNVTYEMAFEQIHPKPNAIVKFIMKLFVKNIVVSETPYKHNSSTAPAFKIAGDRDFNKEKARLIAYLNKAQGLGVSHFEGRESHSFGTLTANEWNNMLYKHLDHHLRQFGV